MYRTVLLCLLTSVAANCTDDCHDDICTTTCSSSTSVAFVVVLGLFALCVYSSCFAAAPAAPVQGTAVRPVVPPPPPPPPRPMSEARKAFLSRSGSGQYEVGGTEFWFHTFTGQVQTNTNPPGEVPEWRVCTACNNGRGGNNEDGCPACGAIDGGAGGPQLRPGDRTFEYLM